MFQNFLTTIPDPLFQATILMTVVGIAVWSLLRITKIQSPKLHRIGWGFVLLQGVLFFHVPVDVPWYDSPVKPAKKNIVKSAGKVEFSEFKTKQDQEQLTRSQAETTLRKPIPSQPIRSQPIQFNKIVKAELFSSEGLDDDSVEVNHNKSESTVQLKKLQINKKIEKPIAVIIEDRTQDEAKASFFGYLGIQLAKINPLSFLLNLWVAGVMVLLLIGISFYGFLLQMLKKANLAEETFQNELISLSTAMGLKKNLPLYFHNYLGPMLCLTPKGYRIVVPEKLWNELPFGERRAVLRHELTHYQRGDVWKSFIARVLVLPHWFNPVSWYAAKRFDESAEWACDLHLSMKSPEDVPLLARALLKVAEPARANSIFVSAATGAPLCTRLKRLLKNYYQKDSFMKRYLVITALLAIIGAGLFRINLVAKGIPNREEVISVDESYRKKQVAKPKIVPFSEEAVIVPADLKPKLIEGKSDNLELSFDNKPVEKSLVGGENVEFNSFEDDIAENENSQFKKPSDFDRESNIDEPLKPVIDGIGNGEEIVIQPEQAKVDPVLLAGIEDLISKISDESKDDFDGGTISQFLKLLKTNKGKLVLQQYAQEKLFEAKEKELPKAWEKFKKLHHGKSNEEISELYKEILPTYEKYLKEIQIVDKELQSIKSNFEGKSETDQLLLRFLNHEHAASILFAVAVKEKLYADEDFIHNKIGEMFDTDENGKYRWKKEFIEDSGWNNSVGIEKYNKSRLVHDYAIQLLKEEFVDWANDLSEKDAIHKQLKKDMLKPLFPAYCLRNSKEESSAIQIVAGYLNKLEEQTEDTADGLVIKSDFRTELKEELIKFERLQNVYPIVKKLCEEFVSNLDKDFPPNEFWINKLSEESEIIGIGESLGIRGETTHQIIQDYLGGYFVYETYYQVSKQNKVLTFDVESSDNEVSPPAFKILKSKPVKEIKELKTGRKMRIRPERVGELNQQIQDWFKYSRDIRRKNRLTKKLVKNYENQKIKAAMESIPGTIALFDELEKSLDLKLVDGLLGWVEEYFVLKKDHWDFKPQTDKMLKRFIKDCSPNRQNNAPDYTNRNDEFRFDNEDDQYENSIDEGGFTDSNPSDTFEKPSPETSKKNNGGEFDDFGPSS